MPRGLGDDPLSKRKKRSASKSTSKHAGASGSSASNIAVSAPETGQCVTAVEEHTERPTDVIVATPSSSPSMSYNDVFFQRKPEVMQEEAPTLITAPSTEEPAAVAAIVQPIELPQAAIPAVAADPIVASPQPEGEKTAEAPAVPPVVSTELAEKVATAQARPENQGFFKRVFGRFRQH